MYLILIRHPESHKNIEEVFSTAEGKEILTKRGEIQTHTLSNALETFVTKNRLELKTIYSSNSIRSTGPASIMAGKLNATVNTYQELRSTYAGSLAGLSLKEAAIKEPNFVRQYKLYRAGLFNSYDIETLDGRETRSSLEKRVQGCVYNILNNKPKEDIKIVIMHRSSITATLIHFARRYYQYPDNFYGYVQLDVGNICCLKKNRQGAWDITAVNIEPSDLLSFD